MQQQTVHLFLLDTLSDWEPIFAVSMINKETYQAFQAHPGRYRVRTVGESKTPILTAAGLTVVPDMTVDELEPAQSAMLILPGADIWLDEQRAPVIEKAKAFLAAGLPVAAICGATLGLAQAGVLNDKKHTGNSLQELQTATNYYGEALYQNQPAVTSGNLITASAIAPLEFAYQIFKKLELYRPRTLEAWYKVYKTSDSANLVELFNSVSEPSM